MIYDKIYVCMLVKMVMMLLPGNRWAAMQEPQPPSLDENVYNSSFVLSSFFLHCGFVFSLNIHIKATVAWKARYTSRLFIMNKY